MVNSKLHWTMIIILGRSSLASRSPILMYVFLLPGLVGTCCGAWHCCGSLPWHPQVVEAQSHMHTPHVGEACMGLLVGNLPIVGILTCGS